MRRVPRPDKSVPVLEDDGRVMSQAWFEYFGYLDARGISSFPDVSATAPTDGQVLIWNATLNSYVPGAN